MRTHQLLLRGILAITMLIVSGCGHDDTPPSNASAADSPLLLNVVDIRQGTAYTCGVAAVQAILQYYGIETREDQLAARLGTTAEAGTSPDQIMAGFESYRSDGLVATMQEQTTLEELRVNLERKIPTMVVIQAWLKTYPSPDWSANWEDGHWVIVIGMDDEKVYFEDPALLGSRGWLTQAEFLLRWHDYTGESPCCDAQDRTWTQLSISVTGNPRPGARYRHID